MNSIDESSKRFNYENESIDNTCLSILQNKFKNIVVVNIDMKNTNDIAKIEIISTNELSKKNFTSFENVVIQTLFRKKIIKICEKQNFTMSRRKFSQ